MAFLKVFTGGQERTVFLGESPVVIGRDQQCDVPIADLKISRRHCILEPLGGGRWRLRDLGSGNGTRVNGEEVDVSELAPEDVIEVGDAKVLYAGEAAVVADAPVAERPSARRPARRRTPVALWIGGGGLLVGALVLLFVFKALGDKPRVNAEEEADYRLVLNEASDTDRVRYGELFLARYPRSAHADDVRAATEAARRRLAGGVVPGFDPRAGLEGLSPTERVARLEEMLASAAEAHRPAVRAALEEARADLDARRARLFGELEAVFREHVERGEYARAREIWFFLRGEPDWEPIPPDYLRRIVAANGELENAAAAERSKLLEEEARFEGAGDFKHAVALLTEAMPRFAGTAVERSLRERLDAAERGLRLPPSVRPGVAPTLVRVDVREKVTGLLARFEGRDFAGAAEGLRALAEEARAQADPGLAEIDARASECEAATALQRAVEATLAKGLVPREQLRKRWRVITGGAQGVRVVSKGEEKEYAWTEAPAELHLALLEREASQVPRGWLGFAAAAAALRSQPELTLALGKAYEDEAARAAVDAFVAARVRKEPLPEGGYVVHAGELLPRREYLRRQEEQLIQSLQAQLEKAFEAVRSDGAFGKLEKLRKRMEELDKARAFALELIFDEQKYFYPYRGTGREGEYQKVQQEVDQRVRAVREIWDQPLVVTVKADAALERALKQFDEAVAGLRRVLVDVDEKVTEVEFLRSYLGKKLDLRTFYRTPEEEELLRYSREVMEHNAALTGDIREVEREQVRVTNEYRMMFGRWAVRLHEKLVLAARGHSEEMARIPFFGHFSPTPGRRTPYDRMKLAGYDYGVSENIVAGASSPLGAHDRWCHSSGHHRNILMSAWTEMGTGQHGGLMTQNYGQAPRYSKTAPATPGAEKDGDFAPWEEEGCGGEEEGLDYEED
jgi:hypothetical protein